MSLFRTIGHCIAYPVWLTGQVIKESVVMAVDTLGTGRHIAPVVIYYPLRVTKERDIAAFMASITMTPVPSASLAPRKSITTPPRANGLLRMLLRWPGLSTAPMV